MKNVKTPHVQKIIKIAGDIILISMVSIGALGALLTAYDIPVNVITLFATLIGAAIVFAIFVSFKRIKGTLFLSPIILIMFLWTLSDIRDEARAAVNIITLEFSKWTAIPVVFPNAVVESEEITIFFIAIGLIITAILSLTICVYRSTILTMLLTIPFALLSFVLLGNQPNMIFILILMGAYLTLLISNALSANERESDAAPAEKPKTFRAMAITLVLLALAAFIAPQDSRATTDFTIRLDMNIRILMSRFGLITFTEGYGWPFAPEDSWHFDTGLARVSDAGIREIHNIELLQITVDTPGVFYLRGFVLEQFDGRSWYSIPSAHRAANEELSRHFPAMIANEFRMHFPYRDTYVPVMTVLHTGDRTRNVLYLPYYNFSEPEFIGDAYVIPFFHNADISIPEMYTWLRVNFYSSSERNLLMHTDYLNIDFYALAEYTEWLYTFDVYRSINPETAEGLRRIASDAGIDAETPREVVAKQVAEFISNSGYYTLSPQRTPRGEDFALHFLQVSRQGYCIHFATAATLMLRALDIPARFTTGYMVNVPYNMVGQTVALTDENAHAWVEVFYDNLGWIPLEVTPASTSVSVMPQVVETPLIDLDFADIDIPMIPDDFPGTDVEQPEIRRIDDAQEDVSDGGSGIVFTIILCLIVACFMLQLLHILLARRVRERRFKQSDTNAAVLAVHRYIARLRYKEKISQEIEDLVLKARFSQHIISEEERAEMIEYSETLRAEIYESKDNLDRFLMDYIWVV